MKKRIILVLLLILALTCEVQAAPAIRIKINNEWVPFSKLTGYPFLDENGRTQVPFAVTLGHYGAAMSWDSKNSVAVAEKDGVTVKIPVGKTYIFRNGKKIVTDTAAIIKDGKVYLPVRAVIQALGGKVEWDAKNNAVNITSPESASLQRKVQSAVDAIKAKHPASKEDFSKKDSQHVYIFPSNILGKEFDKIWRSNTAISVFECSYYFGKEETVIMGVNYIYDDKYMDLAVDVLKILFPNDHDKVIKNFQEVSKASSGTTLENQVAGGMKYSIRKKGMFITMWIWPEK